jgi:hypothetical protein
MVGRNKIFWYAPRKKIINMQSERYSYENKALQRFVAF